VITTDASPIPWGATFQVVEQNIKINEKREIRKLSQEEKNIEKRQSKLPHKFNDFQVELYRPKV
jgi:hypothetical protein